MSTSERLRKGATGVCLVVAPLGLLVGLLLHPQESMDPAKQLGIIASDPDRWAMAHYIIAASAVVLAGAVLGLAHLLHERRPGQAIVGGACAPSRSPSRRSQPRWDARAWMCSTPSVP